MTGTVIRSAHRGKAITTALVLLATGCTTAIHPKPAPPPSAPASIAAEPPYLCDLVPERSFRRITGVTFPLKAEWHGQPAEHGTCVAHAAGQGAPLGINWSFKQGTKILRQEQQGYEYDPRRTLPIELGEGFAVTWAKPHETRTPNRMIVLFRCGRKRPWMAIDLAPVIKGRDALQDMVDLMRIAQRRFGELHNCTPKP